MVSFKATETTTVRCMLMTGMTGWSALSASSRAERNCCRAGVFDILEGRVPSEGPRQAGEMNRLKRNIMKFNRSKCEVLHLGWNNLRGSTGWGNETESNFQEKDLWTAIQWCALTARKANHRLSSTSKCEVRKSMEAIFPLSSAPESIHLEYFIQF